LHEKSGFGVVDFKYAISIFKGTKRVAMAAMATKLKFSRELRELPWQPNLGKNKQKLH